jgi:hypothetical protein
MLFDWCEAKAKLASLEWCIAAPGQPTVELTSMLIGYLKNIYIIRLNASINQSNATEATSYTLLVQAASDKWASHTETEGSCFPRSDHFTSETQPLVN